MFTPNPAENQAASPTTMDVLLVQLAGELYAIPSASVRQVIRYRAYTPVPGAPPALPGILIQRGAIVPVVEIHPLLGIDRAPITRASRLVLVTHGDVDMAILVDMVLDLAAIPFEAVEPAPVALDPARVCFLRGVVQHERQFIALLDLDELIVALSA